MLIEHIKKKKKAPRACHPYKKKAQNIYKNLYGATHKKKKKDLSNQGNDRK